MTLFIGILTFQIFSVVLPLFGPPKCLWPPTVVATAVNFLDRGCNLVTSNLFEILSQEKGDETVYPAFETVCDGSHKETAFYSPLVSIVCKILPRFCQIPIIVVSPDKNLITSGNSI